MKLLKIDGMVASKGANGQPQFQISGDKLYVGLMFECAISHIPVSSSMCEHANNANSCLIWLWADRKETFCDFTIEDSKA